MTTLIGQSDTTSHTQGPWETGKGACEIVYAKKRDGLRQKIANCYLAESSAQSFANASLIAAAPELLEALKRAVAYIGNTQPYQIGHTGAMNIVAACTDAIAKAEGRS